METDPSSERGLPALHRGGTVEPVDRARAARERTRPPVEVHGERYELRDPSADVTYRSNRLADILANADRIGSDRFVAVDTDGQRTTVQRMAVGNETLWQRGPQRPAALERPLDPPPARDEVPDASKLAPKDARAALDRAPGRPSTGGRGPASGPSVDLPEGKAERAALVARLETDLQERYLIKRAPVLAGDLALGHTEYRFRGNTARVAFTESTFRLATDTNSPFVARSMVDVAEARGWSSLRVSGHEEFRRRVWFEASIRGVRTLGYEPMPSDMAWLRSEREARLVNRIEPERHVSAEAPAPASATAAEKGSTRGGGRKAVLAAIEAVLVAKKVPEPRRAAVMAAATEKLAERIRSGQTPKVKVYDPAAPSRRPAVVPAPEGQRTRDRAAPVR